jgi:hypothetical protein
MLRFFLYIVYALIIAAIARLFLELNTDETIKFAVVTAIALVFTEYVFFPVINFQDVQNKIEKKYV